MSGQRNLNPFAATSWTPSASSTASKTVADAQAERRQRQQERDKLKAAESIQRTWRGHRARRNLKNDRRHILDGIYSQNSHASPESRVAAALPLVVVVLDPRRPDDRTRLQLFATDLNESGCGIIRTAISPHVKRLADQFILLLDLYVPLPPPLWLLVRVNANLTSNSTDQVQETILKPLISIYDTRFESVQSSLGHFYKSLGKYCRDGTSTDPQSLVLLEQALLTPIARESGYQASKAFAMSFLTLPNLELFEANVGTFAYTIAVDKVSSAIVESYTAGWASTQPADARLWLLAHFIALGNGQREVSSGSSYLNAMYIQLSSLHAELKKHHIGTDSVSPVDSSFDGQRHLPPFIGNMIKSLVQRDEISHVLEKFTT